MKRLMSIVSAVTSLLLIDSVGAASKPPTETSIWKVGLVETGPGKYKIEATIFAIGDPVHETLTLKALIDGGIVRKGASRKDPAAGQFIRGVLWNDDPCAQLFSENLFNPLEPSFGIAWYLDFRDAQHAENQKTFFRDLKCPLLGRSHYGDLQFLHGMADQNGVKASETAERVLAWVSVAHRIANGEIDARQPLSRDATAKALLTSIADQSAMDLMRASTATETRARALGSLLHTLQDSYAHGHVARATDGAITQFYCYADQKAAKHAHDDSWRDGNSDLERTLNIPGSRDALFVSTEIVKLYKAKVKWAGVEQYLKSSPLLVMQDAKISGPGVYQ